MPETEQSSREPQLLTLADVAKYLKIAERTAYRHFGPPFLRSVNELFSHIRNVNFKIQPLNRLVPIEISKYDSWVVMEALHNCIAHQDYTRQSRVVVTETVEKLTLENAGTFFEGEPDDYVLQDRTPLRYRNPALARAMVNLGMIDTMGYGIKRMFMEQRKRFFPLPDYDLSAPERVKVAIMGRVIDENYTQLLIEKQDLEFQYVVALDRVQKGKPIDDAVLKLLRKQKLVEGRRPNVHVAAHVAEMGGLSPNQVTQLIYTEWGEPGAAVQFNTSVPLADLEKAAFFREARAFLKALHAAGEVRATTSRNLSRRFVAEALPLMFGKEALDDIHKYNKVVNEQDVPHLHYARVVSKMAGLVRLRKSNFGVPKAKGPLLGDDRAGELFRCLFVAFFRKFNLAYTHRVAFEANGLQTCAAYTLYRLGAVAKGWQQVSDLPAEVLLPAVREQIEAEIRGHEYWTTEKLLTSRLIRWFIEWGMLEGRYEQEDKFFRPLKAVRVTSLYNALLQFKLDPANAEDSA